MFTVSNRTAISLLKWGEFSLGFLLVVPILLLLYQDKGITIGDFFFVQGVCGIGKMLFQIPSGYLADVFSRKKVMLFGSLLFFFGLVLLFFAYGLWPIALAEFMLGMAIAMFSGSKESYAYDLLKRLNKEKQFLKEYGSMQVYGTSAGFISAILGGWVYAEFGNWVVAANAAVAFFGILCVLFLPELRETIRKPKISNPIKDMFVVVKSAVRHPAIKWFMLFPAMFGAFTMIMLWILQPTMEAVGISVALFGFFTALNRFFRILSAKYAHKVQALLGVRNLMYVCVAAVALSMAAVLVALEVDNIWIIYACCVLITIVPAAQLMVRLVFNTLMHHKIKSTERTTVLSTGAMIDNFFTAGTMILMKPLLDGFGIEWSMIVALVLLATMLYPLKKVLSVKSS